VVEVADDADRARAFGAQTAKLVPVISPSASKALDGG
jgi:hypothetical protein